MSNNNKRKRPSFYQNHLPKVQSQQTPATYSVTPRFDYIGYDYYFTEKDLDKAKETLQKILSFQLYLKCHSSSFNFMNIIQSGYYTLNLQTVLSNHALCKEWTTIQDDLMTNPEHTINIFALAMHQICYTQLAENEEEIADVYIIYCRLLNHEPVIQIKQLRAGTYGKLLSIRGTIIKASLIGLKYTQLEFRCSHCHGTQVVKTENGEYVEPIKCATKGCRATGRFEAMLASKLSKVVSCQSLKLLELVGDETDENSRMPRTLECEVCNDLVGKCTSGDDVILTGVLTSKSAYEGKFPSKAKFQHSIYEFFLRVNNVRKDKSREGSPTTFDVKDVDIIKKLKAKPQLFRFLVQSLCPKIYGHEIVKAGLLLALFGGTKTSHARRSDSHVLVVGDPGLGKSQLLLACFRVAPRGVLVGASTSTTAGLTVTMCKESTGEYRLEAGAMVLADQGCCCIDEFDNMSAQQACLLEVMEQQRISIAKAGVVCSVPARATVVAAANPARGHYDRSKTVSENLKLKSPLLSRFDLVFVIVDTPNARRDALLGEHVLAQHARTPTRGANVDMVKCTPSAVAAVGDLRTRLATSDASEDCLPPVLFKKYIAHARKCVHPQLSAAAAAVVKRFYVELRREYQRDDSIPVTARQLESLVRLTQARAKLELRDVATADDARDVVDLMRNSLLDVFTDDCGQLDFSRTQNGAGISKHKLAINLLKALQKYADCMHENTFTITELKKLGASIGVQGTTLYNILDSLNLKGYLLKKKHDTYQLLIHD